MNELDRLIDEVVLLRKRNREANRQIEAAACAIREKALREARDAILAERVA